MNLGIMGSPCSTGRDALHIHVLDGSSGDEEFVQHLPFTIRLGRLRCPGNPNADFTGYGAKPPTPNWPNGRGSPSISS